jgi:hypothetical protein
MMLVYWLRGDWVTACPKEDQSGVPTMMMVSGSMARMAGMTWLA